MIKPDKDRVIQIVCDSLIEWFTKYTDYLSNQKIVLKDLALERMFLEPFKWDFITIEKRNLGKDKSSLLSKCLDSECFWKGLKLSHITLKKRYPNNLDTNDNFEK